MIPKHRKIIHEKYNGRCAYCGVEITISQMRIDHIIPKHNGGTNTTENYNPACRSCNGYKDTYPISAFRFMLKNLLNSKREYLFKSTSKMNLSINFNAVQFTEWDGIFYYEKLERQANEKTIQQ